MENKPIFKIGQTIWPVMVERGGNVNDDDKEKIDQLITEFAEYIANSLEAIQISHFHFTMFRPFKAVFILTEENLCTVLSPLLGGLPVIKYMDWQSIPNMNMKQAFEEIQNRLGWDNLYGFELPKKLLDMNTLSRQNEMRHLANDLAQEYKVTILKQQKKVKIQPVFKTVVNNLEIDPKLCFILMPFKTEFNRIYTDILEPTIKETGFNPLRADQVFSPTPIVEDIWVHIAKSRIIIADVTDKNPNVFYELGLAHAIGKQVIIIAQNKEDIPFDIAYIRYMLYSDNQTGWEKLKKDIIKAIDCLSKNQ